ncbi:MAG: 3'(2'),5'-bisphosphate nucleotidase CysQ [Bacilli bacterium]|nr:3'(2'),5'-bisphosphate nucleotidase CysQ [Bacilli bacterium]
MYESELKATLDTIRSAAKIINDGILSSSYQVEEKTDGSPVTSIDKKVDEFIRTSLAKLFPDYGMLTEESKDDLSRFEKEFVWIIDPIDGTEEFIKRQYEFVTNIALCRHHEIVLAVIMEPISKEIYYAIKGEGAYLIKDNVKTRLHVSNKTSELTCLTSPFHMSLEEKEYLNKHQDKFKNIEYRGAAYKACLIASGQADVSYRLSPYTKEWDTAAPQLIVTEAGGVFLDKYKNEITYNKTDVRNLNGYVILNKIENYF